MGCANAVGRADAAGNGLYTKFHNVSVCANLQHVITELESLRLML